VKDIQAVKLISVLLTPLKGAQSNNFGHASPLPPKKNIFCFPNLNSVFFGFCLVLVNWDLQKK